MRTWDEIDFEHVKRVDKEQSEFFTQKYRSKSDPFLKLCIIKANEKQALIEKLQGELVEEEHEIKEELCGHEKIVMKVVTGSMTSYHNKSGDWRTVRGTCPDCGKDIWDEFKVDSLYYDTWNCD